MIDPQRRIAISEIEDEFCFHALIDQSDGSKVRAIEASANWPIDKVRRSLKSG